MSKAQIGRLQNQARMHEEIRKKEQAKMDKLAEQFRAYKRHHYQVGLEFGLWMRQGSALSLAFASWSHHLRHEKALRDANGLKQTVNGLRADQIARMRKYLEMWQGNVERALYEDIFSHWAKATADSDLYRQIAAAEGAAEAARAQIPPLEEQVRQLEEALVQKDAELAAALADAADQLGRLKTQRQSWHE